ncbi:MAG: 2-amino-4-hydroxy-6-hydroxymethyldihydropteridine diphosphokinase [Thermoanaerobaculia bacterium]
MSVEGSIERVVLALGSNLGDRQVHLRRAVRGLSGFVRVVAVSSVWETAPVGCPDGAGTFYNLVLAGWTRLSPEGLLDGVHGLEGVGGRRRRLPNDPRTIDIDIVFYGNRQVHRPGLTIPHPRFRERNFVLAPLREIATAVRFPSFERELGTFLGEGETRCAGGLY